MGTILQFNLEFWMKKLPYFICSAFISLLILGLCADILTPYYSMGVIGTNPLYAIPATIISFFITALISAKMKRLHIFQMLGDIFVPLGFYPFMVILKNEPGITDFSVLLFIAVGIFMTVCYIVTKGNNIKKYIPYLLMDIKALFCWTVMLIPVIYSLQ